MLLAVAVLVTGSISFPVGTSHQTVSLKSTPIELFSYRASRFGNGTRGLGPILVVFHGTLRNADTYRDNAIPMAERFGGVVVAPKFDRGRFPSWRYHRGGIVDESGKLRAKAEWTYAMIPELVQKVRASIGDPTRPYYLIGHSAGGQFLVRMAAFDQDGAARIVAANPGSQLFPNTLDKFPYGFGGLPATLQSDATLKQYLAQPLTLLLGEDDAGWDVDLDTSPEAMRQGPGRFQRSVASYQAARALAQKKGWKFGWRVVPVKGVGHEHPFMFSSFEMADSLGLKD